MKILRADFQSMVGYSPWGREESGMTDDYAQQFYIRPLTLPFPVPW